MKRIISFILTLCVIIGSAYIPIDGSRVNATEAQPPDSDWTTKKIGNIELKKNSEEYYDSGTLAVDFGFSTGANDGSPDISNNSVLGIFDSIMNTINNKLTSSESSHTIEGDYKSILTESIEKAGYSDIADNSVFSVVATTGLNKDAYNELGIDIEIVYIADTLELNTLKFLGFISTSEKSCYTAVKHYNTSYRGGQADITNKISYDDGNYGVNYSNQFNGAIKALKDARGTSLDLKPEIKDVLKMLENEDLRGAINNNIDSRNKEVSYLFNDVLDIVFTDAENGFDITFVGKGSLEGQSAGPYNIVPGAFESDILGPVNNSDTLDDIKGFLEISNKFFADNVISVELEAELSMLSTGDFIWDYLYKYLIKGTKNTSLDGILDATDNTVELYNLNVYKAIEHVLRMSLVDAKTNGLREESKRNHYIMEFEFTQSSVVGSNTNTLNSQGNVKTIYVTTEADGNYIKISKVNYNIKTSGGVSWKTALTTYQMNSLISIYNGMINNNENTLSTKSLVSDFIDKELIEASSDLTTAIVDEDMVKSVVEEFETSPYARTVQGVIDVARLANTLMQYTVYHATSTNYDLVKGNDGEGMPKGTYNSTLHGILADWNVFSRASQLIKTDPYDEENDGKSFIMLEMPSEIGVIGGNTKNLTHDELNGSLGFDSIMTILHAQSYVFEALKNSAFGLEGDYSPENLKAILDNPDMATEAEYAGLGDVISLLQQCKNGSQWDVEMAAKSSLQQSTNIWVLRCIIELGDVVELLDIDTSMWSQTIDEYYRLFTEYRDAFDVLRKSPVLYGTGYTGGATIDNPLGVFYSVQGQEMSEKWNIGFANSALYVPMVTNLYDASVYEYANTVDIEWISEFMYKYGFHRKALYISTDPNIVVNNKLNKSSSNGMVIATLNDLLNYDRDIQLYIDTGFYNAEQVAEAINKVDYATLYQYTHEQDININVTDEAALNNIKQEASGAAPTLYNEETNNFIDETLNLDTKTLLKDDDVASYSNDIAKNVTHLGQTTDSNKSLYDGYILSANYLTGKDNVFSYYNYTPMLSYGIVSAIYRDVDIFNELAGISKRSRMVFESSKNILYADGTNSSDWISYMNYIQLSNLEKQMNVNVETKLDLESPIFIDIFGNIVTESGFVIIPAASNATLCEDTWTPYTIGFGSYMSSGMNEVLLEDLPADVYEWLTNTELEVETEENTETSELESYNLDNMGSGTKGGWFVSTRKGTLQLKNVYLESYGLQALVNWGTLNANSDIIQSVFWNNAFFNKAVRMYNNRVVNMVTEVLRGAPIENIDYEVEGITGVVSDDAGIIIAYALDALIENITGDTKDFVNSMTTMPNLALMKYLNYVIYFSLKIVLAVGIIAFLIMLFRAGVKNRLGLSAVFKLALTAIIVVSAIYILPNTVTWSYDNANANLLSSESEEILLYNTMRKSEGQQIGITKVDKIDEDTELLVKVDDIDLSWSNILTKAILTNEYTSFQDLFDDSIKDTPYYQMSGVVQKGTSVYMDVNTILNSTSIAYNKTNNALYNKNIIRDEQQYISHNGVDKVNAGSTDPTSNAPGDGYIKQDYYAIYSFTSPYYVFLDQIIANINEYNQTHNIQTYTASVDAKGKVITYDIAAPYFMSDEFLVEGYDILGLTDALMCERKLMKHTFIFDETDKANIKESAWYPANLDEDTKQQRIAELYNYARSFVIDHVEVIKHIPDEMLIKVLAFACSVEYNKLFKCEYGDSIALITVDNRDLLRFMIGDFKDVYSNVSYSFGRFVYHTSGTLGVIFSSILMCFTLIATVLKPALVWILFIIIIINILFREMLFDKPNQGVEGYFIGCALFICLNYAYALMLKLCFTIAESDASNIASILVCIGVQVLYLVSILYLIYTQVKDWRNGGFSYYSTGIQMVSGLVRMSSMIRRHSHNHNSMSQDISSLGSHRVRSNTTGHFEDRPNYRQGETLPPIHRQEWVEDSRDNRTRSRRNRPTLNRPSSLEEMRLRDEERESSPYNQ